MIFILFAFFTGIHTSFAAEESLDLDQETLPQSAAQSASSGGESLASKFNLMGRVDLTSDINSKTGDKTLQNYHFFLFLKLKASDKVNFMGEFVGQRFYEVEYEPTSWVSAKFGKIMVPFGDTRYFHHFYGGLQGYGATGVMFPNVWAEPGLSLDWKIGSAQLDTYVVKGISASDVSSDPNFQNSASNQQAYGLRFTYAPLDRITAVVSAYTTNYWSGRPLYLFGGDIYTDYGALGFVPFKIVRLAMGMARAWVTESPTGFTRGGSNYQKRGDYIQLSTKMIGPGETRIRYGTYIEDTRVVTSSDVNNINVAYQIPIDVIKVLLEYQWNFEAVNEVDNDLARVMVSVDF